MNLSRTIRCLPLVGMGVLSIVVFSACSMSVKPTALGFLYGYDSVLRDYKAGRIMKARSTVLHMDKSRPDYADARRLFKRKIEPARLRLRRHYVRAANHSEKTGAWFRAKALYEQAASLSVHKAALLRKARRLDLRMRQIRVNKLLVERRKDDARLLKMLNRIKPPKGLSPTDGAFARQRQRLQKRIMSRARSAWLAAKRELREGFPEVAFVEIESFRRLRPAAEKGEALMAEIKQALPKGLHIPTNKYATHSMRHRAQPKAVSAADIQQLMQTGKWLKAKQYATSYQLKGGAHADRFLKTIEQHIHDQAAAAFKAGRMAFRTEHLDKAAKYWRLAVSLRPDHAEYRRSLNRVLQLQERLRILRNEKGGSGK